MFVFYGVIAVSVRKKIPQPGSERFGFTKRENPLRLKAQFRQQMAGVSGNAKAAGAVKFFLTKGFSYPDSAQRQLIHQYPTVTWNRGVVPCLFTIQ